MDRRDFLRTTGTLIAGATVASGVPAAGYAAESAPASTGRMVLPINRNWRYGPESTSATREMDRKFHAEGRAHSAPGNPP